MLRSRVRVYFSTRAMRCEHGIKGTRTLKARGHVSGEIVWFVSLEHPF